MIKNKINFKKLFLPMLCVCGAVMLAGLLMLILFGGKTFAHYTLNNLKMSLFVKALVAVASVLLLTTGYFLARYRKAALWFSVFTALSALINGAVAFFLCVICRAHLGDITFALMLLAVVLTYVTALTFVYSAGQLSQKDMKDIKRNKKSFDDDEELYEKVSLKTYLLMRVPVAFLVLAVVISFVLSVVYSAPVLMLYALPAVLTTLISVMFTIAFGCRLYSKKL